MSQEGKHQNRTVVLFLGVDQKEYQPVIEHPSVLLGLVILADRQHPFCAHKPDCAHTHRFTRHGHYSRGAIPWQGDPYEVCIWQVRCLDCGAVFSILPSFLVRYQRFDAACIQQMIEASLIFDTSYRHTRLLFNASQPQASIKDPRTIWSKVQWLGSALPVTQLLLLLELSPPSHILEDEKFASENGTKTYIPAIVQGEYSLIWWIDYVPNVDAQTLKDSFGKYLHQVEPLNALPKASTQDGWKAALSALSQLCKGIVLQQCHRHLQEKFSRLLATFRKTQHQLTQEEEKTYKDAHWNLLKAPDKRSFSQRLRRLKERLSDPFFHALWDRLKDKRDSILAYLKDSAIATVTTLQDQLFRFLDRKLFMMGAFREETAAYNTVNAWAIARNCWRFMKGAKRQGCSPIELAGADLQDVPWLQAVNLATQWAPLRLIQQGFPLLQFAKGGPMPRASPRMPPSVIQLLQNSI
jgi:hypothetical protein